MFYYTIKNGQFTSKWNVFPAATVLWFGIWRLPFLIINGTVWFLIDACAWLGAISCRNRASPHRRKHASPKEVQMVWYRPSPLDNSVRLLSRASLSATHSKICALHRERKTQKRHCYMLSFKICLLALWAPRGTCPSRSFILAKTRQTSRLSSSRWKNLDR